VGNNQFPEIGWDKADQWQTITAENALDTDNQRITQIQVLAMAGNKNTYTVSYAIMQSNVDTLQMIYVQGDSLSGFDSHTHDYYITLAAGDSVAPSIAWQEGDAVQTVKDSLQSYTIAGTHIGWKQTIEVQAQNGQNRIYTLYFLFSKILSTDANLSNIYLNGQPLNGFNPEQYNYIHPLLEDELLPSVLVEKGNPLQTVNIQHGDTTIITVIAEDTTAQATYTVLFQRQQSPYSYLHAIYQDGVMIEGFEPDSFLYDITLPFGTTVLPEFTYDLGKEGQTVMVDTFRVEVEQQQQTTLRFSVTAPDPMYSSEYDLRITVALSSNCALQSLMLRGEQVPDFHPDTTNYLITYPIGTDSAELATVDDLQAVAEDANAEVQITANGTTFSVLVNAHDGKHSRIYTIEQSILLSDNALLAAIYLDSTLIRDFDAEQLEYTYYITDVFPAIEAVPADSNATVDYSMYVAGEPFYIYVTAHDGSELVYTIQFLPSTIDAAAVPMANDVLMKHIPGTKDLAFATLRKNVSVAVYTLNGHMLYYSKLEETSQNDAIISTTAEGSDILLDIFTPTNVFTLPELNQQYIYCFYENEKRRIASGKISITK
jgi:hypothetical protein